MNDLKMIPFMRESIIKWYNEKKEELKE